MKRKSIINIIVIMFIGGFLPAALDVSIMDYQWWVIILSITTIQINNQL